MTEPREELRIVADFPELNKRLREATEGIVTILQTAKQHFGTEDAECSFHKEEYQRLYRIVDVLIEECKEVRNGRVKLLLEGVKYRMRCMEALHRLDHQSVDGLDFGLEFFNPETCNICLWDVCPVE